MKSRPRILFAHLATATLLAQVFTGCIAPRRPPASATPDNSLITYWPRTEKSKALRLAIKDLIDMKGVVTTAGSEFLAKHSKPADRDAACLTIARRRNVAIVGKANLSEFAVRVTGMNTYFGTPMNPANSRERLVSWWLIQRVGGCGGKSFGGRFIWNGHRWFSARSSGVLWGCGFNNHLRLGFSERRLSH